MKFSVSMQFLLVTVFIASCALAATSVDRKNAPKAGTTVQSADKKSVSGGKKDAANANGKQVKKPEDDDKEEADAPEDASSGKPEISSKSKKAAAAQKSSPAQKASSAKKVAPKDNKKAAGKSSTKDSPPNGKKTKDVNLDASSEAGGVSSEEQK